MKPSRNICTDPKCRNYQKYCRAHIMFTVPPKTEISKVSDKMKDILKRYQKISSSYLKANPFCEAKIEGCTKVSVEIHHKRGKVGEDDYLDQRFFLAVCRSCHDVIEKNPAWAKQQGFSLSRLNKTDKRA